MYIVHIFPPKYLQRRSYYCVFSALLFDCSRVELWPYIQQGKVPEGWNQGRSIHNNPLQHTSLQSQTKMRLSSQNGHCLLASHSSAANLQSDQWQEREREMSGGWTCTLPVLVVIPSGIQGLTFSSTPPHQSGWQPHSFSRPGALTSVYRTLLICLCSPPRPTGQFNVCGY